MVWLSNALSELISGKTPEAIYDQLHASRLLSERGLQQPDKVLACINNAFQAARERVLVAECLAIKLVQSGFLNEAGERLAEQQVK